MDNSPFKGRENFLIENHRPVPGLFSAFKYTGPQHPIDELCAAVSDLCMVEMLKFGKVLGLGENLDLSESLTTPAGI